MLTEIDKLFGCEEEYDNVFEAEIDQELQEAFEDMWCTCGAYVIRNGKIKKEADCLCGYG